MQAASARHLTFVNSLLVDVNLAMTQRESPTLLFRHYHVSVNEKMLSPRITQVWFPSRPLKWTAGYKARGSCKRKLKTYHAACGWNAAWKGGHRWAQLGRDVRMHGASLQHSSPSCAHREGGMASAGVCIHVLSTLLLGTCFGKLLALGSLQELVRVSSGCGGEASASHSY